MKILILNDRIPPENRGGAGAVVWRLAQALKQRGHTVQVVAATEKPSFGEIRDDIPTTHIHSQYRERFRAYLSLYNPRTIPALKKIYHDFQPDVINAHNIHTDLSYHSLTLARNMNIPTVFSAHDVMPFAYHKASYFIDPANHDLSPAVDYQLPPFFNLKQMRLRYNPLRNIMIRRMLQQASARTTPSQALADAFAANGLYDFQVAHNGIDVSDFQVDNTTITALRARLNLQGRRVILFAGRLTGAKGTGQLLNALKQTVETVPEATLLVLSSASIDSQVTDSTFANLRENHIISGGWLSGDDLKAAFHLADVVVAPSIIFDTFPTVNLEAMATTTPVLATCYGGSREVVITGETGYIINPYHTDDFAEKLTRLLTDDTLRQQMGQAGYQHVMQHFSIESYIQNMLQIYENTIKSH
ncbi:MAG: glycosyltransferase family 4 protein [Aggregatilineales bacterium]